MDTDAKISFTVGLNCMQLNVSEVDSAVQAFSGSTLIGIFPVSSWKYPHQKIADLDVTEILEKLQASAQHDSQIHYIHLCELLIDRLYYALVSAMQYVCMLTGMVGGSEDNSFFHISPLSVEATGDSGTIETTNMAGVIRKLHEKFRILESTINKYKSDYKLLLTGAAEAPMIQRPCTSPRFAAAMDAMNPESQKKLVDSSCQTEETQSNCCDSCEKTQTVLKYIGDILEQCWRNVSFDEPSQIGIAKAEIRNNLIWGSQWGAVTRWCTAIKIDTSNIIKKISSNMITTNALETELRSLQTTLNRHLRDHELAMGKNVKKVAKLQSTIAEMKKERSALLRFKSESETKLRDLQNQLQKRDNKIHEQELQNRQLTKEISGLEKINEDLVSSQKINFADMAQIKKQLESERESHKIELSQALQRMKSLNMTTLRKRELEIEKLQTQITTLEEEWKGKITEMQDKVELLTMYPDLNGGINPPVVPSPDNPKAVIESMEKQIQSNQLRMQILQAQSVKLGMTLEKLRAFLSQQ